MSPDDYLSLATKLAHRTQTPAELEAITLFLQTADRKDADAFLQEYYSIVNTIHTYPAVEPQLLERLRQLTPDTKVAGTETPVPVASSPVHRIHLLRTAWVKYAAAVIIVFGITVWLLNKKPSSTATSSTEALVKVDVAPGGNKAILTLADGSTIDLDSVVNGQLARQAGSTIQKTADGQITYTAGSSSLTEPVMYNTMSTPRGGQYSLSLSDGSRVWLNAASSITFPTAFSGDKREVRVTGEAYFEINRDPAKPFTVKTLKESITVLGTSFNVNSYTDEPEMKITLLEGSVRINNDVLEPGEAYVNGNIIKADVDQAIAWKNGIFNFNQLPLKDAMRQLGRWYNLEIVYENNLPTINFYGEIGRDLLLGQVLNGLSGLGVQFTLKEGNRLVVARGK